MRIKSSLGQSALFLLWMTLLTGVIYPLGVTLLARLLFPAQAQGSLLVLDGRVRGSRLLAQDFSGGPWFLARPSAAGYATVASGASNLGPANPAFAEEVAANAAAWERAAPGRSLPPDMATSSASGLDPDISLEAALGQLDRVAAERGLDAAAKRALEARIRAMAAAATTLLGPPRVNVVDLNASLGPATKVGAGK